MTSAASTRSHAGSTAVLRWVLGAATAGWFALALAAFSGATWGLVRAAVGLVLVSAATLLTVNRLRSTSSEREMWRPVLLAAVSLAIGFILQTVMARPVNDVFRADAAWLALPFAAAVLLSCAMLYRGLVQWNRFRTAMSDPADWLNGLSSVLALAAAGNVALRWTDSRLTQWPWWEQQSWLLALGATLTLLGTLATVTSVAELARDSRAWLLSLAVAIGFGGLIAAPWSPAPPFTSGSSIQNCWLVALALIAYASSQAPKPIESQPSTTRSTSMGTLVVMVSSVAILAISAESGLQDQLSMSYALAAFVGASTQGVRIMRELSQLAQSRLEARTDDLTGVANRRELVARLETAAAGQNDVALLLVDLDRFKEVNDRHGHAAGDELLKRLAQRLQTSTPSNALVARLGGDEFAVLLRDTPGEQVMEIVTGLAGTVSASANIHGRQLGVGVSIGVAFRLGAHCAGSDVDGADVDGGELLRRADVAMYVAKRNKLQVSVYDEASERETRLRSAQGQQLRAILTDPAPDAHLGELIAYFQPQIDARTGDTVGVEALARWRHPELGLVAPDTFLPLVEEQGLMTLLTTRVLDQAVAQAAEWRTAGAPMRMAVNVSASSLTDAQLPHIIETALLRNDLPAKLLTIEITETTLMSHPEQALDTVRRIAATGVSISIDDYGTGYSSLAYLNDLAADELKIDRELTRKLVTSTRTAAIIGATIELAHQLGLRVVAEGVEDQATHDALRALRCDELQGFLYGPPVTAATLTKKLHIRVPVRVTIPSSRNPSSVVSR
jgi:diguanylate cyclase (GGDEF)-like protein